MKELENSPENPEAKKEYTRRNISQKKKKKFTTSSKTVSAVPMVQTDEAVE